MSTKAEKPYTERVAKGIYWGVIWAAALSFLFQFVIPLVLTFTPYLRDSTDAPRGPRSGLMILSDHMTGCQYLTTKRGGISPRLDHVGDHVGCTR